MKDFSELRHDFNKDPALMSVLNGCSSIEDIKDGFAKKGYAVTDENLNEFCEEKLPEILKLHPELKEVIADATSNDPDLNGIAIGTAILASLFTATFVGEVTTLSIIVGKSC